MKLDLRRRLTLIVTVGAALVLGALAVGFNITLRSSLAHDSDNVLSARASAALGSIEVNRGVVRSGETPDQGTIDTLVWVYSGTRAVERPRAPASLQAAAEMLNRGAERFVEDSRSDVRLLSVPIQRGNGRAGTVVVGISLAPYERTASRALVASIVFALIVFLLVVLATSLVVRGALRPVETMTAEAAAWSEHDLDHRFHAGEPHDELTRLAATFDSMLDRLAASLRHEQRFSAEVSHELKTPLAAIAAEAELALRRDRPAGEYRDALQAIASRSRQLQGVVEILLATARGETGNIGTAEASAVATACREACAALAAERGVELQVSFPAASMRIGADSDAAERVLVPLVENACRYARSHAEIQVRSRGDHVEYLVTDDGPGVTKEERERIFEPGVRGSAAASTEADAAQGAGLGLALARRLARALEGDVTYEPNEAGFVFRAPRG
ncbi:MAG: hypothetical protein QOJ01_544 [Solirubrobacterales bacterium]|jgi:signal transduction histidine kinase|nr:hypothetical protein [Solirubrobacterales bacterium]